MTSTAQAYLAKLDERLKGNMEYRACMLNYELEVIEEIVRGIEKRQRDLRAENLEIIMQAEAEIRHV